MNQIKLQYEARYHALLGFPGIIREKVAPLQRISKNATLQNPDTVNERIVLNFLEDGYRIDIRMDRAILVVDGEPGSTLDERGLTSDFFAFLNRLAETSTFAGFRNHLLSRWMHQPSELEGAALSHAFVERYLSPAAARAWANYPTKAADLDVAVALERGALEDSSDLDHESVAFGPFIPSKDIASKNLYSIAGEGKTPLLGEEPGLLFSVLLIRAGDPTFTAFKALHRRADELLAPFDPLAK